MNGVAWCMMFVWWVFREAGFSLYKTASCTALTNRYKTAGQWVTSGYKPGDIVMFDFSGKRAKTEHVGIVEAVSGGISQDFMTIYAVIIAFYFGTQSQKVQDVVDGAVKENAE